jgi:hypothetical protein
VLRNRSNRSTSVTKDGAAVAGHTQHEDYPWTMCIDDHPPRVDSPGYIKSRALMNKIARTIKDFVFGKPPYEDHHGGGLWLKDESGWFLVRNLAGMEWVSQFCADATKVDALRINAKRLYARFPEAAKELKIIDLLDTPITDAADVANWTDSICNASVPLSRSMHIGTLPRSGSLRGKITGVHHYPSPVVDIQLFKREDFTLWVTVDGVRHAVVPVSQPTSGDARVRVLLSEVASQHGGAVSEAAGLVASTFRITDALSQLESYRSTEGDIVLPADHPIARAAFAKQDKDVASCSIATAGPTSPSVPDRESKANDTTKERSRY